MSASSERIRDERTRLGKTLDEFAEAGGVSRRSQVNYESGQSQPSTDYLSGIANIGADVMYVVTGVRSGGAEGKISAPKKSAEIFSVGPREDVVAYGPASDGLCWRDVLEIVIDQLQDAGLTLPGEKVIRLTDLLVEYQKLGVTVDQDFVGKQIRLVA